ncbi:MAG: hypothetical protein OEZ42_02525 [Gemmatimonadota bacterium]|nr:hypothetical protein [Gemmatimonadota bacterium]
MLALSFLGFQPWVACGIACHFELHPGQGAHHGADHQAPQCHTGSWTQTAMAPFGSQNVGLPSPSIVADQETVAREVETPDPPAPLSSWISAFDPPPPRA